MARAALSGVIFMLLYALTGPGALAFAVALFTRRRWLVFVASYAVIWMVAQLAAPALGRVPIPCRGEVLRMQSVFYCVAMRNFVTPDLHDAAMDAAVKVATAFPGTVTLALDGNLPLPDGLPLVPHLSHDDGDKLDFAFYYTDADGSYRPGVTRSPIGYWAFETGSETCPPAGLTLRWGMSWLQPLWPDRRLEPERTRTLIRALAADGRIGKIFVEPPLAMRLGLSGTKIRFQGCRAARHDDHIHVQL